MMYPAGPNRWIGRWRGMGGGRGRGGRRPWSTTRRRHITIYTSRHDTDTTSGEPTRCYVADMVCVVSATWRRHVGADIVLGGKNPRHDADITSQDTGKIPIPKKLLVTPWYTTLDSMRFGDYQVKRETTVAALCFLRGNSKFEYFSVINVNIFPLFLY